MIFASGFAVWALLNGFASTVLVSLGMLSLSAMVIVGLDRWAVEHGKL